MPTQAVNIIFGVAQSVATNPPPQGSKRTLLPNAQGSKRTCASPRGSAETVRCSTLRLNSCIPGLRPPKRPQRTGMPPSHGHPSPPLPRQPKGRRPPGPRPAGHHRHAGHPGGVQLAGLRRPRPGSRRRRRLPHDRPWGPPALPGHRTPPLPPGQLLRDKLVHTGNKGRGGGDGFLRVLQGKKYFT